MLLSINNYLSSIFLFFLFYVSLPLSSFLLFWYYLLTLTVRNTLYCTDNSRTLNILFWKSPALCCKSILWVALYSLLLRWSPRWKREKTFFLNRISPLYGTSSAVGNLVRLASSETGGPLVGGGYFIFYLLPIPAYLPNYYSNPSTVVAQRVSTVHSWLKNITLNLYLTFPWCPSWLFCSQILSSYVSINNFSIQDFFPVV